MIEKRLIPVLSLINEDLVKTIRFSDPKYLGDPINAIRIFNEKEVDELVILDIRNDGSLDVKFLESLVSEAFMPIAYGGGLRNIDHIRSLMSIGIEKFIFNTALHENPSLISECARLVGSSSTVYSLDFENDYKHLRVRYDHASKNAGTPLNEAIKKAEELGVGEIILHDINREGTFKGMNHKLFEEVQTLTKLPVIALGGASSYEELEELLENSALSAVAAGSLFCFKNKNRDSILINYPKKNYG